MGVKPLSCTHCGAGDVREVKPNIYFCNYCDQVFRWVEEPVVGGSSAEFCTHGNKVAARCHVCKSRMCATACNPEWRRKQIDFYDGYHQFQNMGKLRRYLAGLGKTNTEIEQAIDDIFVRTTEFGYLLTNSARLGDPPDGKIEGPFMPRQKIRVMLSHEIDNLSNLCGACEEQAAMRVFKAVTAGQVCEYVWCGKPVTGGLLPGRACRCCQGTFCNTCLDKGAMPLTINGASAVFHWDPDLCRFCAWEEADKRMPIAESLAADYGLRPNPSKEGHFDTPPVEQPAHLPHSQRRRIAAAAARADTQKKADALAQRARIEIPRRVHATLATRSCDRRGKLTDRRWRPPETSEMSDYEIIGFLSRTPLTQKPDPSTR